MIQTLLKAARKALKDLVAGIRALVAAEPAVVAGLLAAVVVVAAGHFGIILDKPTVTSVLTPIIVGIVTRRYTTPAKPKA